MTVALWVVLSFLVVASLAPLSKIPFGAVRGFAFPRQQLFLAALFFCAISFFVLNGNARTFALVSFAAVALLQAVYIAKFTWVWPCQSMDATPELRADEDRRISLIAANVKKSNRSYAPLINLIARQNADIVMAIEVDAAWIEALEGGVSGYDHWVRVPLDTGYGLCVMSKLRLDDVEVRELITDGVPSIRTKVKMRSGEAIRLYVVHPEPPLALHDTKGRDGEIALIGMEATRDPLPAIVTGDLNDVAWSTTTRRFQRLSKLLDPRVGRGFYNTFHAYYPIFRWPLDHLFHDARFRLIRMDRLEKIGSDHFPMIFELALAEHEEGGDVGETDHDEKAEVRKMIREERQTDREAIGSHWEDED